QPGQQAHDHRPEEEVDERVPQLGEQLAPPRHRRCLVEDVGAHLGQPPRRRLAAQPGDDVGAELGHDVVGRRRPGRRPRPVSRVVRSGHASEVRAHLGRPRTLTEPVRSGGAGWGAMETADRRQLLLARFQRQDLHRAPRELGPAEPALLDLGVQDTGPDGAPWALEVRGAAPADEDDLAYAWTLRGAPHAYRRSESAAVAVATAALSEADAAKRVFDASKPLRAAGIPVLEALATVAEHQRDIVRRPTVKGELSTQLTARVDEPYLRWCRPCQATHLYEQPFRLAALQAGLELEAGTSPPVLRRIPGLRPNLLRRLQAEAEPRFDVVRNHLRFAPGLRRRDVVAALESTAKDVAARWPRDVVEVAVAGEDPGPRDEPRHVLAEHLDPVRASRASAGSWPRACVAAATPRRSRRRLRTPPPAGPGTWSGWPSPARPRGPGPIPATSSPRTSTPSGPPHRPARCGSSAPTT